MTLSIPDFSSWQAARELFRAGGRLTNSVVVLRFGLGSEELAGGGHRRQIDDQLENPCLLLSLDNASSTILASQRPDRKASVATVTGRVNRRGPALPDA